MTTESWIMESLQQTAQQLLTPGVITAVLLTLAITHAVKTLAHFYAPKVTRTLHAWRAFCTVTSIIAGTACGFGAWLASDSTWVAVPVVAFASGPVWAFLRARLPRKYGDALLTETDLKFIRERRKT